MSLATTDHKMRPPAFFGASIIIIATLAIGAMSARVAFSAPPPPRAQRLEDAVTELNLTPDQQHKANEMLENLRVKERQLREDFLKQMGRMLTPQQMRQLQQTIDQPRPAGPRDGRMAGTQPGPAARDADAPKGTVVFEGGFETDPRDRGRPVVLIAAGLNISADLFRDAFSGVRPAGAGEQPQDDQVRRNKQVLLQKLAPHGVTDDQLNTVSNYYRYSQSQGEMWKTTPATATAVITNGVVTAIKLTNPGAGYCSPPTVVIAGYDDVHAVVRLKFGTDLANNGSIESITIEPDKTNLK